MPDLETTNLEIKTAPVEFGMKLSGDEQELFQELFRALRAIRYGSVVLTLHDGHVVEIQKTERIRKGAGKQF
jgi:hypothetical protein